MNTKLNIGKTALLLVFAGYVSLASASPADSKVHTCGSDLRDIYYRLCRQNVRVFVIGGEQPLTVPAGLRGHPVSLRSCVEQTATARGLKVVWLKNGSWAVLQAGAPDNEIETIVSGLKSENPEKRAYSAWKVAFTEDIRVIDPLVTSLEHSDPETAAAAGKSLSRLGWDVVIALHSTDPVFKAASSDYTHIHREVRRPAILAVGKSGTDRAVGLLGTILNNGKRGRRSPGRNASIDAAEALGNAGSDKALSLLIKYGLNDVDLGVRIASMRAIGNIGGDKGLKAVTTPPKGLTERTLSGMEEYLYEQAVTALGKAGNDKALEILEKELTSEKRFRRLRAVSALGYTEHAKALALLENKISDKDPAVRKRAASSLGKLGGEKAVTLLESMLSDTEHSVQLSAAEALGQAGGNRALDILCKAVENKECGIGTQAILAMGRIGTPKALSVLEKALSDPDRYIRLNAVSALACIGNTQALELLVKAFSREDRVVRQRIIREMENIADSRAVLSFLQKAFSDKEWLIRARVMDTAVVIGGEKAVDILEKALNDPMQSNRIDAYRLLSLLSPPGAMKHFIKGITDKDADVRKASLFALSRKGGTKAITLLEKGLDDKSSDVRERIVRVLGRMEDERAWDILRTKGAYDRSQTVKLRSLKVLGTRKNEKNLEVFLDVLEKDKRKAVQDRILWIFRRLYKDHPKVKEILKRDN